MIRTSARTVGAAAAVIGILAAALSGLWPARLGGSTTYVITSGNSMHPTLVSGDLVAVRPADRYAVGDIAAYRSGTLHTVVLHRIVAVDHGRFTFKGDSNSWLDPEPVVKDQLIGILHVHLPGAGLWIGRVFHPWTLAPLLGLLTYLGLEGSARDNGARRRHIPEHAARSGGRASLVWRPSGEAFGQR